ncbi:hypothetical protein EB796_001195 [Bugula neritina]|uniref:Bis(5'-adenosyl)-triphosphatase n=1 Tax=Bugula neritina TaxID=10212 RepID=A0A7J7KQN4_BUGNE|nr:hypothetical protein EB796_001195 [Bugula neritina]
MSSGSNLVKVAVCQMTATPDSKSNLEQGRMLIEESKRQRAQIAFLPEGFDNINRSRAESVEAAQSVSGPTISEYCAIAKANNMWLSLGGFKEKSDVSKVYNTHLIVDPDGNIAGAYRKMHLFDVDIPDKVRLCESDYTLAGNEISKVVATPAGNIGLSTCYDLRFPELSALLRNDGADILTYPSAFTIPTGKAHWEVLLRARAIENQCYVVAAAQVGAHHDKRASYGHSMIVDPWGKVLCEIKDGIGVATADIDLQQLQQTRESLPVDKHKRRDVYRLDKLGAAELHNIDDVPQYMFAQYPISSKVVFCKTNLSFAFVNRKPVVPGHVLVSPLRVCKRFHDLTTAETSDLFEVVKKVGDAVTAEFGADSLTISIQDGPDAGQTVEHVHVHILPRKKGDFENNDDIYKKLATHDKQNEGISTADNSIFRAEEVMAREATSMRKYFHKDQ